jgi:dTDP-4-dehydrorhamnose 3,5-epimerase
VRGFHFQWDPKLGKILRIVHGRAFVAAVDLRKKSPTFGRSHALELSPASRQLVYAPFGFGTAFLALEDGTEVEYYYSALYNPKAESSIRFDDPEIGVAWPRLKYQLSPRDAGAQSFQEWVSRSESDFI